MMLLFHPRNRIARHCFDSLSLSTHSVYVKLMSNITGTNSDENLDGEPSVTDLVRNFDWTSTPLGPIDTWPRWLKFLTVSDKVREIE